MGLYSEYKADVKRTFMADGVFYTAFSPFFHAGMRAMVLYRLGHRLRGNMIFRLFSAALKRIAMASTDAEIHPAAEIGGGIHLPHPSGIVIGPTVTIAGDCTIFQQVTLGPRVAELDAKGPTLEKHTFVYPGAKVLGEITIGARTQIGPNCVVFKNLPEGTTVMPPEPTVLEGLSFGLRFGDKKDDDEKDSDSDD
jgi:serine O-acetyltransferase